MASKFDHQLIETTLLTSNSMVDIYKVGGGTLGHRYEGFWGYRVRQHGKTVAAGDDLHTGLPKTHQEAAELACEIFSSQAQGALEEEVAV